MARQVPRDASALGSPPDDQCSPSVERHTPWPSGPPPAAIREFLLTLPVTCETSNAVMPPEGPRADGDTDEGTGKSVEG